MYFTHIQGINSIDYIIHSVFADKKKDIRGNIQGVIVDSRTKTPIPNAFVTILTLDLKDSTNTKG